MSLQTDIYTALSALVSGRVYPQFAPQEAALPFVVWRILGKTPLTALGGYQGLTQYSVAFDAWADTHDAAMALARQIETAVEASALISYRESAPSEDFEPDLDAFIEPVYFGFWYTT